MLLAFVAARLGDPIAANVLRPFTGVAVPASMLIPSSWFDGHPMWTSAGQLVARHARPGPSSWAITREAGGSAQVRCAVEVDTGQRRVVNPDVPRLLAVQS